MGASSVPRINEVIAFLDAYAPDTKARLKERPELAGSLEAGVLGGKAETVQDEDLRAGLDARAEVLAAALKVAIERSHAAVDRVGRRLMLARRTRFISEVLAAIGASGVIGTALLDEQATTLAAGILTLVASLCALFVTKVVLGGDGRETEMISAVRQLIKLSGSAEMTQQLLERLRQTKFDAAEMKTLLENSNVLFQEITNALSTADF